MSWEEFELAMGMAFMRQGYRVTQTKSGADGGVDLVLERPGERILAQCKHWAAWKVNVKTVRELYGVMAYQGATGGIVVTSGRFTQDAKAFAREVGIRLLDRDDVIVMLRAAPSAPGTTPGTTPVGALQAPRPKFTTPKVSAKNPARRVGITLLALSPVLVPLAFVIGLALIAGVATSVIPRLPTAGGSTHANPYLAPYVAPTPTNDSRVIAVIQVPDKPNKVTADQIGHRLYVTGLEANSLMILDIATNTVASRVALDRQPGDIAFDSNSRTLWISNYNDGTVSVLDENGKSIGTIAVSQHPTGIAIDTSLHKAYVANGLDGAISVVDTGSHKVLTTVKLSYAMGSGAIDPTTHDVCFVVPSIMNMVYCYDAKWKLAGYGSPGGESFADDSVTHSSFGVHPALGELRIVDGVTKRGSSIPLHATPTGLAVDSSTHLVYVADHDGKAIQVIRPL